MKLRILVSSLPLIALLQCASTQSLFDEGLREDQNKKYDSAITFYDQATAKDPAFVKAYNNKALILFRNGDVDGAIKEIDKAIAAKPDYAVAIGNKGLFVEAKGDRDQALKLYEQAATLDPTLPDAPFNAGNLALKKGDPTRAADHLEKAYALKPDDSETMLLLGRAQLGCGHFARAQTLFQDLRKKDPKNRDALLGLIQASNGMGTTPQTIQLILQFMEESPDCSNCLNMLGSLYTEVKDYDQAISTFEIASRSRPGDPSPKFHLGFLYYIKDKKELAAKNFEDFLKLKNGIKDDQTEKAERMLKALKKSPG